MDALFLDDLHQKTLSPARRTFILQEILLRAQTFAFATLSKRIERVLLLDRQNVRDQYHRRHLHIDSDELHEGQKSWRGRREAHLGFLAILLHIEATFPPTIAQQLLAPAEQQIRRLQDFATRGDHTPVLVQSQDFFHRPTT